MEDQTRKVTMGTIQSMPLELRSPSGNASETDWRGEAKGPVVPVCMGQKGLLFVSWSFTVKLP